MASDGILLSVSKAWMLLSIPAIVWAEKPVMSVCDALAKAEHQEKVVIRGAIRGDTHHGLRAMIPEQACGSTKPIALVGPPFKGSTQDALRQPWFQGLVLLLNPLISKRQIGSYRFVVRGTAFRNHWWWLGAKALKHKWYGLAEYIGTLPVTVVVDSIEIAN